MKGDGFGVVEGDGGADRDGAVGAFADCAGEGGAGVSRAVAEAAGGALRALP